MSGLDKWGEGESGAPRAWGRASDNGHVYQSGGDQHVTHFHFTVEAQGEAAHEARERADVVVQVLARAVGEWAAKCKDLEEQARRAKAEGRAEAHAELSGRLRDAELRVIQAQRTMRKAEAERAKAEALLAQAYEELARQRWASYSDRDTDSHRRTMTGAQAGQESQQFAQLLEQAEAELGAVRDELRLLTGEMASRDAAARRDVLVGGTVDRGSEEERDEAPDTGASEGTTDTVARTPAVGRSTERQSPPDKPRPSASSYGPLGVTIGVAVFFAAALPLPIIGSAIRTMYSAKTNPAIVWGIAFDIAGVVVAALVSALVLIVLAVMFDWHEDSFFAGFGLHIVAAIPLFITGLALDPDTVPALTSAGRIVVEYFGPL